MKYYGGCDVGSTYTKAVILDENGKMVADTTIRSKIQKYNQVLSTLTVDEFAIIKAYAKAIAENPKVSPALYGAGWG